MLFYAGCIIEEPAMENPTLVFLTDRNELDDQLFGQFQRCYEILRRPRSKQTRSSICASCSMSRAAVWF